MPEKRSYDTENSTTSLKEILVKHFLYAMDDLRSTWQGKPLSANLQEFNLDLLYLISLIPNADRQAAVLKKWQEAKDENYQLKENAGLGKDEIIAYAGMSAVTEIIRFLCDSFELATEDITGPGTSKEYVDSKTIEIPDYEETTEEERVSSGSTQEDDS